MSAKTETVTDVAVSEAHAKVAELLTSGEKLGKIEAYLMYMEDYSVTGAKKLVAEVREELGIEGHSGGTANWAETVTFLRANHDKLEKKELINGMCKVNGKTFNTNQHAYNYIHMAMEWAKQASEESQSA